MGWGNPTSFLPVLPRDQGTLAPLAPADLLSHMDALKEMYMPPIHGGFTGSGVELDEGEPAVGRPRGRTLSGGSVDLPGLGLEMEGLGLEGGHAETIAEEDESDDYDYDGDDGESEGEGWNDPFEREWAQKWLEGVVRRAQTWLEDHAEEVENAEPAAGEMEALLREATAVLALMAGTSAAGSVTRHLLFPLAPELGPALRALRPWRQATDAAGAGLSPETRGFLAKLASSPISPTSAMRAIPRRRSSAASHGGTGSLSRSPLATSFRGPGIRRPAALPVLLHDAPISDHLSVGVQTWGSAILLGREMALRPAHFGLFIDNLPHRGGTRVLELGAGTGLLSILCRKLLDLRAASTALGNTAGSVLGASPEISLASAADDTGLVVATDFHPDVLANLRVCVDLNTPPRLPDSPAAPGIDIAKLDWTTFPAYMRARARGDHGALPQEDLAQWLDTPFDLVLASDCVYDPTHAAMLRDVGAWVLRPPRRGDRGGTLHLLSPIRPTFTPELESIDVNFPPLASYRPLAERAAAAQAAVKADPADVLFDTVPAELRGEGLGVAAGLRLGVRGAKRAVQGRRGEGRTDEASGYWWWEVGWG